MSKLLVSGPMEVVVARQNREETYQAQIQELSTKLERMSQERDVLKGDNLRLKHRISYLEEIRHDGDLIDDSGDTRNKEKSAIGNNKAKTTHQQQHQQQKPDSPSSNESHSLYRSEIQVQTAPVRQKPPRTSKIKTAGSNSCGANQQTSNGNSSAASNTTGREGDCGEQSKRTHSSLDTRRVLVDGAAVESNSPSSGITDTSSIGRIKTSSIVDRHFGHVIRVTHHHHPQPTQQPPLPPTSSSHDYSSSSSSRRQRAPVDSVSVSDLQSVASYDSFVDPHHIGRHNHIHKVGQSLDTVSNVSLMTRHFGHRSPPSPTRVLYISVQ